MKVKLIAAVSEDGAIGKGNELLWYIPEDLQHYKSYTTGKYLIVGSKTYDSLPIAAKKNRYYLIVGSSENNKNSSESLDEYMNDIQYIKGFKTPNAAIEFAKLTEVEEVIIVGGAMLYETSIEFADECCITWVHATYEDANKFFPITKLKDMFDISEKGELTKSSKGLEYTIYTYTKK